jgi:hypothetical protein
LKKKRKVKDITLITLVCLIIKGYIEKNVTILLKLPFQPGAPMYCCSVKDSFKRYSSEVRQLIFTEKQQTKFSLHIKQSLQAFPLDYTFAALCVV